jgi:hypothetical protein
MLVYIMGRPHSGSTILDLLLGNGREVCGIGQLVSDIHRPLNPCACEARICDCPFWRQVRSRVEARGFDWERGGQALVDQAHVRRFWSTWWAADDDPGMRRLAEASRAIAQAVTEVSGKRLMLDSSKEPTRALLLMRYLPEARFIRLVRDPRSAVASHYWRLQKGFFHFLRRTYPARPGGPFFLMLAAASWTVGNLLHELVARRDPRRVVVVRYEDLRERPMEAVRHIGAALGIDVSDIVDKLGRGDELALGHIIGGNEIRLEKGLRFDPQKQDRRPALPRWVELMTVAMCWPLMLRYRYPLRRPAPAAGQPGGEPAR